MLDLTDGYFPSELQERFPDGVPFQVSEQSQDLKVHCVLYSAIGIYFPLSEVIHIHVVMSIATREPGPRA